MNPTDANRVAALGADDGSTRLRAALAIGAEPSPGLVEALIARCAVEPDFFVREMLTWALTRHSSEVTLPGLLAELRSERPQARSQALHTLSKIRDASAWPAITPALLRDSEDEVARSAWRAAVVLAPEAEKGALAAELATQLGRGGREMHLSLSRAFAALGEEAAGPALEKAKASPDPGARAHALVTERLLRDPHLSFDFALEEAKRVFARGV
jgi:HEAT repeat protein